ncbi:MAG: hypothetical protein C0402_12105 [Thermodesulfovibrio sp.]|nr:hypothetical protein [Thermodesulfovibrio sp.]
MRNNLEIFIASFDENAAVRYSRIVIDISEDVRNPDEIVKEEIRKPSQCTPQIVCSRYISHSTSWRYEADGSIYLTYLVFSDHADFTYVSSDTLQIHDMQIPPAASAENPRPNDIKEEHVISHGMRHLSHLVNESKQEMYRSALSNKSLSLFARIGALLAGKL